MVPVRVVLKTVFKARGQSADRMWREVRALEAAASHRAVIPLLGSFSAAAPAGVVMVLPHFDGGDLKQAMSHRDRGAAWSDGMCGCRPEIPFPTPIAHVVCVVLGRPKANSFLSCLELAHLPLIPQKRHCGALPVTLDLRCATFTPVASSTETSSHPTFCFVLLRSTAIRPGRPWFWQTLVPPLCSKYAI